MNYNITKLGCLAVLFLFSTSCTVYTEKQSEALSRTVYATKDSLDNARIDLADAYANQATRIVKPPKSRIEIKGVYKKTINVLDSQSKTSPTVINKQRVIIIPERYKNDTVVVVSSEEYEQLLKDKEIFDQIAKENNSLQETKKLVDEELIRQLEYNDKMIKDLNIMQKKLVEKDLAILQRNVIIIVLLLTIGGATYLRIKGIL
jgi:hypothetical protein